MYLSFYGLSEKPFSQTPDPKFLYWNDHYRETIASLRYGIQERKGFITMIGEAGTGKTTLLRKLLDDLGPDVVSVFLFNPNASFEEILEYTLSELGIPAASGRKLAMMQRLNDFLLAAFQEGKNTILLIDEAQDLETEVLESLRLLSNLETSTEKILQIVLSGQPELAARLAQPNLRQLKQRIAVRCRIEPLGRHELADFIAARLSVAGGRSDMFAPATLDPIWEFSRGIPRLINTCCDNALLLGYAVGKQTIDADVIAEVVHDLGRIDAPYEPAPAVAHVPTPFPPIAAAPAPAPPPAAESPARAPASSPAETLEAPRGEATASPPPLEARPAPPPRSAPSRHGAVAPAPPRRRGIAIAASILLIVAVAAAWVAFRWNHVRPRLLTLLADPDTAPSAPSAARAIDAVAAAALTPSRSPAMVRSSDGSAAPEPGVADPVPADPAAGSESATGDDVDVASSPPAADTAGGRTPADAVSVAAAPPAPAHAAAPVEPAKVSPAAADDAPVAREPDVAAAAGATRVASVDPASPPRAASQDLQVRPRTSGGGKKILVQRGDTLMNLAAREYGYATYTVLDVVRSANPDIQDVNRIIAGSELVFPDPGPRVRVSDSGGDVSVLVATTPALGQAQEIQRLVGSRYHLPADLEPVALGDGRSLYRVSLRKVPDQSQAMQIAESLGSILRDPS